MILLEMAQDLFWIVFDDVDTNDCVRHCGDERSSQLKQPHQANCDHDARQEIANRQAF